MMSKAIKFKRTEWAAMLLAAFFVVAPLAIHPIRNFISRNLHAADNNRRELWHSYEWATLGVLIFQAWIYHRQRGLMDRQASIADRQVESIERLERPLILPLSHLGHVDYRSSTEPMIFPKVDMNFENYGRSPAFVDRWDVAMIVSIDPPKREPSGRGYFGTYVRGTPFVIKDGDEITHVTGHSFIPYMAIFAVSPSMGPGERYGRVDIGGLALNAQQAADVVVGTQKIWIDGIFLYSDVWGRKHETWFCWKYDPDLDIFIRDSRAGVNGYS